MKPRMTTEEFIIKARKVHGDKYDYSKVVYESSSTPVCIICPEHGEFLQTPNNHLRNHGCRKCSTEKNAELYRSNKEEFVNKARKVHGDKYDYSKVVYKSSSEKVCIICPEHGEFLQSPDSHLHGSGCPKCVSNAMMTTEDFVNKARKLHGDKYDYSKVVYKSSSEKVCIICPEHGEFRQIATSHIQGGGCPKCATEKKVNSHRSNKEEFVNKARKVHGDKYDYSKVVYKSSSEKVCIICPEHGEFWQTPSSHIHERGCPKCKTDKQRLNTKSFITKARKVHGNVYDYSKVEYKDSVTEVIIGCPKCGTYFKQRPKNHLQGSGCPKCGCKQQLTTEEFIMKSKEIHSDKYDYSKVNYENSTKKVCIICPEHGEFYQSPNSHLCGKGCPKCAPNCKLTPEEFVKKARIVHGDKYDYSKSKYINNRTYITITCPIHDHGDFPQRPRNHLFGQGCPYCHESKLENFIKKVLEKNHISFVPQKKIYSSEIKKRNPQKLDFYIPELHLAIECQGEQHYIPVKIYGGNDGLETNRERDERKYKWCNEHGIKVIYFTDSKFSKYKLYKKHASETFTSEDELIEFINSYRCSNDMIDVKN